MKRFDGFPARMEYAAIPSMFFSSLLPEIDDLAELKTTLHVLAALCQKRGYPRLVTYRELLGNTGLMESLRGLPQPPEQALRLALEKAAGRGTLLHLTLEKDGADEDIYLLNSEASRQVAAGLQSGEIPLKGVTRKITPPAAAEAAPNIYTLYEDNIGILTPMVAEELRSAEKTYPESWLRDAVREAALRNKRNIRYVIKILERWAAEGKSDGTYQRDSQKTDPDKYIKGKYGHMVRR